MLAALRVTRCAYSSVAFSLASNAWLRWKNGTALICSSVTPARFAEAVWARVQYSQSFSMDVLRYASSLYFSAIVPSATTAE